MNTTVRLTFATLTNVSPTHCCWPHGILQHINNLSIIAVLVTVEFAALYRNSYNSKSNAVLRDSNGLCGREKKECVLSSFDNSLFACGAQEIGTLFEMKNIFYL